MTTATRAHPPAARPAADSDPDPGRGPTPPPGWRPEPCTVTYTGHLWPGFQLWDQERRCGRYARELAR